MYCSFDRISEISRTDEYRGETRCKILGVLKVGEERRKFREAFGGALVDQMDDISDGMDIVTTFHSFGSAGMLIQR